MSDVALQPAHLGPVLGSAPSGPTLRRTLTRPAPRPCWAGSPAHGRTPARFPGLVIAGKTLTGGLVINIDATLVTAIPDKEGAAPTWKKS